MGTSADRDAERFCPLHPRQGTGSRGSKHKPGPLFYSTARTRGGKDSKAPYKKVGERLAAWVRAHGVFDEAVKPNHGWRHRLSSILIGMRVQRVIDSILGHKGATYGTVRLDVKKDVVDRIPRIELDAVTKRNARAPVSEAVG